MTLQTKYGIKYWVAGLLGFSGMALGTLVPGGPIETRSFGHIQPLTLSVFNTFLTTLVLGSLLLVYFVLKSERWAMWGAAICGLSLLGVYGLDLAEIFPVSPDAMPPALLAIELLGSVVSVPLMVLAIQALQGLEQTTLATAPAARNQRMPFSQMQRMLTVIVLGLIGLGIIIFATRSAMGI